MKSVHYKSTKYRDILIKMSLLCEETELTSFVDSIDDLEILLIQANPVTNSLLEKAFTATRYCDDIETVDSLWTKIPRQRLGQHPLGCLGGRKTHLWIKL